ncbi:hypothetical protein DFH09DRAFT_1325656 [Mycena vulgaris]|nr:hypothetical protein DFH09DRAFT_1325656 [Mycena vulgaris]
MRPNLMVLSSLRPETIKSSDFLDLAGCLKSDVYLYHKQETPLTLCHDSSVAALPFPPHARGYLYYFQPPPGRSPLGGGLRLRVNSDDSLGSDLLLPNGLPWQIGLPQIVKHQHCAGALYKLLEEGLLTPPIVEQCHQLFSSAHLPRDLIFDLDQPFPLSLTQTVLHLTVVGLTKLAVFRKQLWGRQYPFKGDILVRFELSPDKTRVFFRVVRIVVPVVCSQPDYEGNLIAPREGEFLSHMFRGVQTPRSSILTHSKRGNALRLLVDR